MNEDSALEIESDIARDEQYAAWREMAWEALGLAEKAVWLAWTYGMLRLAVELAVVWMKNAQ